MQRALVKVGQHSLVAAVPSTWIKRHRLKKGDRVEFTEVENKLVVTSSKELHERKVTAVLLAPTREVAWRVLQPLYTSGYDEIRLTFKDSRALKHVESLVALLIGCEIVETGSDHVVIKSVSKALDEEFETILRRTFHVFNEMAAVTYEAFKDHKRFPEVHVLELTINKYTLFLKRLINRTGYKYPHYTYLLVSFLELAANQMEYIARFYTFTPSAKTDAVMFKDFQKLQDLIRRTVDLFYQFTPEKFLWIAEKQPHFKWFTELKQPLLRHYCLSLAEYLVQMARQIEAIHL